MTRLSLDTDEFGADDILRAFDLGPIRMLLTAIRISSMLSVPLDPGTVLCQTPDIVVVALRVVVLPKVALSFMYIGLLCLRSTQSRLRIAQSRPCIYTC
jgi:hypothetical protein